jgi:hypothetical protein
VSGDPESNVPESEDLSLDSPLEQAMRRQKRRCLAIGPSYHAIGAAEEAALLKP